jgi:hypothetical protein
MKTVKRRLPTEFQSRVLRRIAQTGAMMLTHREGKEDIYTDAAGYTIDSRTALTLINRGWVIPEKESMFDLMPQSWRAKSP